MKNISILIFLVLGIWFSECSTQIDGRKVETGLERVPYFKELFRNKDICIITNHTAYNSKGQFIAEVFQSMEDVHVVALCGPEHGIRGQIERGDTIYSYNDSLNNIPIISLYGKSRKPSAEILKNINLLVFDIQDVGARFYTYIYNMALAMEAAAESNLPFVVLDRPNPINGVDVEGNILDTTFSSFMGLYPIPVRHGMTAGELARLFNGEGWLKNGVQADLTVIPMKNWKRSQWYDETGLQFIPPSPNMIDLTTATIYPGMCLLEGSNLSEGRGTMLPFQIFGAPWFDAQLLTKKLNALHLPGVSFKDTSFTPVSIPAMSKNPNFQDTLCFGAKIRVTDRDSFKPYYSGLQILNTLYQMNPDNFKWVTRSIRVLSGTDTVQEVISNQGNLDSLVVSWKTDLNTFMKIRQKYLLYE